MASVLRRSGPDIERNGVMVTPRALISTCDYKGCGEPAPFGDTSGGKLLSWCRDHNPDRQYMAERKRA